MCLRPRLQSVLAPDCASTTLPKATERKTPNRRLPNNPVAYIGAYSDASSRSTYDWEGYTLTGAGRLPKTKGRESRICWRLASGKRRCLWACATSCILRLEVQATQVDGQRGPAVAVQWRRFSSSSGGTCPTDGSWERWASPDCFSLMSDDDRLRYSGHLNSK